MRRVVCVCLCEERERGAREERESESREIVEKNEKEVRKLMRKKQRAMCQVWKRMPARINAHSASTMLTGTVTSGRKL